MLADADAAFTPYGKVQWVRPGPRKTVDWKGVVAHFDIHSEELEQFTNETLVSAYVRGYWRK